ncbi:DNA mismatch repair protein MutL [compost metagenome]
MAKIQRLPIHVANQIAAGEVIERPASVVKELVENAIDAGARRVTVDVTHGGRNIRVTDDGEGMTEEDALLAFERFATSKLKDTEELWRLYTMGFRGEALASIASIAKVECLTRPRGGDKGTQVVIHGGSEPQVRPAGCPEGTTFVIQDLFYNTPARLKFLRAAGTEQGHIQDVVTALALCHPEVDFKLVINGRESLSTVGARTLREVMAVLLGDEVAESLGEVEHANEAGAVKGLVSRPHKVRGDRSRQWFFINKRWVRDPLLAKGVEEAFVGHIPSDRHPIFVLHIELDPALVDINVHPAKKEVRLGQTHRVYGLLREGVVKSFTQAGIELPPPSDPSAYPMGQRWVETPAWYKGAGGSWTPPSAPDAAQLAAATAFYRPAEAPPMPEMPSFFETAGAYSAPGLPRELDQLKVIAQLHRTYIMCEHPEGLFLIDQHNSHERWLYEQLAPAGIVSQELLMPLVLTLTPSEMATAEEYQARLQALGFGFEPFGRDAWVLRALPALLPLKEAEKTVRELLSKVEATGVVTRLPDDDPIRRTIACHSAIKAGETLTHEQMQQIIERLKETQHPLTCPHGRPTGIMISMTELNRRCLRS